jgi:glycosyltransferase involved in cell wall biosynthesis
MVENKTYLSVVSPVYLAEGIVDELVKRITEEVSKITQDYEIILVEDGSEDKSWQKIEENCETDKKVKGIKLSRNFGQHYAITAGLRESKGDYVVVMDCDLQDNPKYIHKLLEKAKDGNDIVLTIHTNREHGIIKNIFSKIFHRVFNWLAGNENLRGGSQYGALSLLTRKVVQAFSEFNDYHRHYLSVIRWLGFSKIEITVDHEERFIGKTSYSFKKLIILALDGIISQTDKLLRYSIYIGFSFTMIGLFAIIYIVLLYFYSGFQSGWASIIVLIIFSTGLILMNLGIVCIYLGKLFDQVKNRPLFIIEKKINV